MVSVRINYNNNSNNEGGGEHYYLFDNTNMLLPFLPRTRFTIHTTTLVKLTIVMTMMILPSCNNN